MTKPNNFPDLIIRPDKLATILAAAIYEYFAVFYDKYGIKSIDNAFVDFNNVPVDGWYEVKCDFPYEDDYEFVVKIDVKKKKND